MYNLKVKYYENNTLQVSHFKNPVFEAVDRNKVKNNKLSKIDSKEYLSEHKLDELKQEYFDIIDRMFNGDSDDDLLFRLHELEDIFRKNRALHMLEIDDEEKVNNSSCSREENVRRSQRRTKQKIIDYGRNNVWDWFFTLTLSPDKVDRSDFVACSKIVREYFRILKRSHDNLKYLIVPEQHKKGGYHFHALVSGIDGLPMTKAVNPRTGKLLKSNGKQVYNIDGFKFGFSTATRITDTKKTVSYVVKYITKELCEEQFGKQKYYVSENCKLPEERTFICEDLEAVLEIIKESNGMDITFSKKVDIDTDNFRNTITYFELE